MLFFFKENIMNASKKELKNDDFITYHIRTFIEKVYV